MKLKPWPQPQGKITSAFYSRVIVILLLLIFKIPLKNKFIYVIIQFIFISYAIYYFLFIIQYLCTLRLRTRYEESRVFVLWFMAQSLQDTIPPPSPPGPRHVHFSC